MFSILSGIGLSSLFNSNALTSRLFVVAAPPVTDALILRTQNSPDTKLSGFLDFGDPERCCLILMHSYPITSVITTLPVIYEVILPNVIRDSEIDICVRNPERPGHVLRSLFSNVLISIRKANLPVTDKVILPNSRGNLRGFLIDGCLPSSG